LVKSIYLDGCSLVHGPGLQDKDRLAELFRNPGDYVVKDQSRLGKSNLAIVMDTYKNYKDYDIMVLGFTYSSRFYMQYQGQDLDFFPGFHGTGLQLDTTTNSGELEASFLEVYKYFYSTFESPFCDQLSDTIIDGLLSFLKQQGKTVIAFSWEPRTLVNECDFPYLGPKHRLTDNHLNASGTHYLFDRLQQRIYDQQG
jgi:hypothetical protein